MGAPAIADRLIEQGRQGWVGHRQPAPRRDAVGDIGEALRPDPGQISKKVLLQQGAVQLGHAVDVVAAHHRQVGHAHPPLRALLNQGNALQNMGIAGIANPGHAQEAGVDLVDDLQLAGQQLLKQLHAPGFQGLRQQGVVGVADAGGGDRPSGIPIDAVLIHQQPHQLSHGDGWMGVV